MARTPEYLAQSSHFPEHVRPGCFPGASPGRQLLQLGEILLHRFHKLASHYRAHVFLQFNHPHDHLGARSCLPIGEVSLLTRGKRTTLQCLQLLPLQKHHRATLPDPDASSLHIGLLLDGRTSLNGRAILLVLLHRILSGHVW